MSALASGAKKRKKSETKPQAQINKCNNEKRRREQENIYIEELAELISANFADMSSLSVKPDKCAILQETVNQIRSIKQRESASRSTDPVQQGEVSSSRPSILSTDVYGHLLLEALDGFLFVVNGEGKVEHVTKNVQKFIKFTDKEILGETIYNFIHPGDHASFVSSLPMSIGWGAETTAKSRSFSCRLLIKSDDQEDPVKEKQQQRDRYELMYISSTQLTQDSVPDDETGDSGPCLLCVASRITHRDRASIFTIEQFTTKLDTTGKIIGIDTSGVTAYTQFLNKDLMGRVLQELCAQQDLRKLTQHLRDTLSAGQGTSVTYRLKLSQDNYVHVQTKSKLFKAGPLSSEADFIMATHAIIGENDQTRPNDPGGGNNNNNNSVGGPLMTSIVNGTSRNGGSLMNNDSPATSLSNSMNSANSSMFTPFLETEFSFDLRDVWGDISLPDTRTDCRQSLTPASTPTSRPPSAPAYSPGGAAAGQSPMSQYVTQQSPAPNPSTPATYSTFNYSPVGENFQLDDQKDTKVNLFEDNSSPMMGGDSAKLRDLLTKPPNSVESSDSDNKNSRNNKNTHKILKDLLNQKDEDDNENKGSPKLSSLGRSNSGAGPSESKPNTSTGNNMLRELLSETSDDDDRDVRAGLKPQSELLQQLLKEEQPKQEPQSQEDSLLRSLGFPSPTSGEGRGVKRTHEERDQKRNSADGVSSSGTTELWKKNQMLAKLLATQPNPQPIPPIPSSIITATPQDRLPKIMPDHNLNKTGRAVPTNIQQTQHQTQQNVLASSRNATRMATRQPTTSYLNQMLSPDNTGIQRSQNGQFNNIAATTAGPDGVPWDQTSGSDPYLSQLLDQVIDIVQQDSSNDILNLLDTAPPQNNTNGYQQHEVMAINKIQESLMQIETMNSPTSPNIALTVAPPTYPSGAMTTQSAGQPGFQPPPPGYQRSAVQRPTRPAAPQFPVSGGGLISKQPLMHQKLAMHTPQQQQQYDREKVRLLTQQRQQHLVIPSNATVEMKPGMQNIDSLLNNTVAPNVSLQRSNTVTDSQLSPTYRGQIAQQRQRQGSFPQTTVGNYQHNTARLSPHPPYTQQLSPRQVYPSGTNQNTNPNWQQNRLTLQQQQNPMLNAQLTGNFVSGPSGRGGFPVQHTQPQQQQAMGGSPGTTSTRHSPYSADTFPPGSPNASFNQNQYLRLQRANSAPTATTQLSGGLGSPRPYGREHPPHSSYPPIPQSPHHTMIYQQDSQYCYDQTGLQLPYNGADRGRVPPHLQSGVTASSGTTSEYVRQELRNVVGARAQAQPASTRPQSQILTQNVTPDLDLGGLNYDLPTTGASESPKLWAAMGSDMGSMSPQPATSRTTMEEGGRQGDHNNSRSSLLQKLLSE